MNYSKSKIFENHTGTSDLDIGIECPCGEHINLYVENYEHRCHKCKRVYRCIVNIAVYMNEPTK